MQLQNFGVSFSIISVITGVPSLFLHGLVRPALSTLLEPRRDTSNDCRTLEDPLSWYGVGWLSVCELHSVLGCGHIDYLSSFLHHDDRSFYGRYVANQVSASMKGMTRTA